jgi:hypothetical protein
VKVSKRALKVAKQYAMLDPVFGYPDLNAAILLAKALLRIAGKDST